MVKIPNQTKSDWSLRQELSIINGIVFKSKMLLMPEIIRSDDGHQYSSSRFKNFAKDCIFQHTTSHLELISKKGEEKIRRSKASIMINT